MQRMDTMHFSMVTPGETLFGWQNFNMLPSLAMRYGTRAALARGGESFERSGLCARVSTMLGAAGISLSELPPQTREPEPEDVDAAVAAARAAGAEVVIAIGGGSILDLGKAVAALVPQDSACSVRDYLEGVGSGKTLVYDPLPMIAVPTTAGTGSEATKNAVISSCRDHFKKSLRDRRMMPDVALIDPELMLALPPRITAESGLDALTQLIESYTSNRATPITATLAERGLHATRALTNAYHDGMDRTAREQMSFAAYLSGVCLANAGLGAAHAIAAALGSVAPIGHGLACAIALPWVMVANASAVPERYSRIAEILTGESFPNAADGVNAVIEYVWRLLTELRIPRAVQLPEVAAALREDNLPTLAALCHGNSLNGNPRSLDDNDLVSILRNMRDGSIPGIEQ